MRPPTFQSYLFSAADYAFVIIDDADKVMASVEMSNVLKTALEFNSRGKRIMRSLRKKAKPSNPSDPNDIANFDEKSVEVQFQIIWCTNGDPVSRWSKEWDPGDIQAVLTRAKVLPFNFTNEEVLDIIKANLDKHSETDDIVTADMKLEVYVALRNAAEARNLANAGGNWTGISFRDFNMLMHYLWIHLKNNRPMAAYWNDYFIPTLEGTLKLKRTK